MNRFTNHRWRSIRYPRQICVKIDEETYQLIAKMAEELSTPRRRVTVAEVARTILSDRIQVMLGKGNPPEAPESP